MSKKEIALVLSSGGARGIAHIGAIEELERRGYTIKSIAGTSMGALVGGIYAAGGLESYKEWMMGLDRMDVFSLVDFTFSTSGIVKGEKVLEEMKKIIPDKQIEELNIPYTAVSTDVIHGDEVVFDKGSLYEAIRASVSIPSVFTPFEYKGLKLVDGAVLNPVPINRVKRNKNDMLVVVDVNAKIPFKKVISKKEIKEELALKKDGRYTKYLHLLSGKINSYIPKHDKDKLGYFNLLNKTSSMMVDQIAALSIKTGAPDILINIPRDSYGGFDFYKAADIIQLGSDMAKLALDEYERREEAK